MSRSTEDSWPRAPYLIPYEGRRVPHLVIEVNQRCNIRCAACYKHKDGSTKPLAEIQSEIDQALALRDLKVITLAGGEPTLHPELPEIVRYATGKGLNVQMLTNGSSLGDELLDQLAKAGLKELFLHVDSLQRRPDAKPVTAESELNPLRRALAAKVVRHGIHCSLAFTVYRKTLAELPEIVRFTLTEPDITRLLVTCCTDFDSIGRGFHGGEVLGTMQQPGGRALQADDGEVLSGEIVRSPEVARQLADALGMRPFSYVGSSRSDDEQRWLFYYSFTLHRPGKEPEMLHLAPTFSRVVRLSYGISRLLGRKYSFADVFTEGQAAAIILVDALLAANPRTLWRSLRFLAGRLSPGARLQHKSFTFQQGPNLAADGQIEHCRFCPDATLRDGVLVPVCLVDYLKPAAQAQPQAKVA